MSGSLTFIEPTEEHAQLLLDWRTRPDIAGQMLSAVAYDVERQKAWLRRCAERDDYVHRILCVDGVPAGARFFRITLPLLVPGILSAGTIAFVLAGTAFATPLVLGGSAVRMVANSIYDQAMVAQNMPVASALCAIALFFTLLCLFLANILARRGRRA